MTNLSIKDLPDILTIREAATLLRVSPLTIKRWGKAGTLPTMRINSRGDRRYKKEDVLKVLETPAPVMSIQHYETAKNRIIELI